MLLHVYNHNFALGWYLIVSRRQRTCILYNTPNSTSDYVVEVSRFTWHSLEVIVDGKIIASFPKVSENTVSFGYTTFHVPI